MVDINYIYLRKDVYIQSPHAPNPIINESEETNAPSAAIEYHLSIASDYVDSRLPRPDL
jgi:hypothetical protein